MSLRRNWRAEWRQEEHPPVEMRFVDMFMTALGSLLFLALLLVLLLPKNAEFMTGTVVEKATTTVGGQRVVRLLVRPKENPSQDGRRPDLKPVPVLVDGKTELGRTVIEGSIDEIDVGHEVIVAGKSSLDGTLNSTLLHRREPFLGRQQLVEGTIVAADKASITVRARDGATTTRVTFDGSTKLGRYDGADTDALRAGRQIVAVGRGQSDGSVEAKVIHVATDQPIAVSGKIIDFDGTNLTVAQSDGARAHATLGVAATVVEYRDASSKDLISGRDVVVVGKADAGGTVAADTVHVAASGPVALVGKVIALRDKILRISMADGSTRDVLLADSDAALGQRLPASKRDLRVGRDVAVIGRAGPDSSFIATDAIVTTDTQVFAAGKIKSRADQTLVLTLADGSEKAVIMVGETQVQQSSTGSIADLLQGRDVMAGGKLRPDGSIEASTVLLRASAPPARDMVAVLGKIVAAPQTVTGVTTVTVQTADGDRRLVRIDAKTEKRQDGGTLTAALTVGTEIWVIGRTDPKDGAVGATVVNLRRAPTTTVTGKIIRKDGQTLTVSTADGQQTQMALAPDTTYSQQGSASASDLAIGQDITATAQQPAGGPMQAKDVHISNPAPATVSWYRSTVESQAKEIKRLNDLLKKMQTEHIDVLKRGFSVELHLDGCSVGDVYFYARHNGQLVDIEGRAVGEAVKFDAPEAVKPGMQRPPPLFGESYHDLTAWSGTRQIKIFSAVARVTGSDGYLSTYVALRNAASAASMQCGVSPVFVTSTGLFRGEKIVLNGSQPFAYLRHFHFNADSTTTLRTEPSLDQAFMRELTMFSDEQSRALCKSGYPWQTKDAHLAVITGRGVPNTPCLAEPGGGVYDNMTFAHAGYMSYKALDADVCHSDCQRDARCVATEFLKSSNTCFLHDHTGDMRPSPVWRITLKQPATAPFEAPGAIDKLAPGSGKAGQDCWQEAGKPVCGPEMVVVPAATVTMGSPPAEPQRSADEGPAHAVTIAKPFAVGKVTVTFAEWDACAAAGGCVTRSPVGDLGWGRGRQPVINVSWDDAQAYTKWLSVKTGKDYRLLAEAEWEYAARAGSVKPYFWGDQIGSGNANCDGCGSGWDNKQAAPVGSFKPNAFGLYDMHGNVWQWVGDCWHGTYQGAPTTAGAWTASCPDTNQRVVRGGSWYDRPQNLRSAARDHFISRFGSPNIGFRVARSLTP